MKPGKLSVRFILSDRELWSDNPSSEFERTFDSEQSEVVSADESEIGIVSESEDDWYSCESSDDEDEYFYDAVSLVNSHDASLSSLPTRSLKFLVRQICMGWHWAVGNLLNLTKSLTLMKRHTCMKLSRSLSSMRHTCVKVS